MVVLLACFADDFAEGDLRLVREVPNGDDGWVLVGDDEMDGEAFLREFGGYVVKSIEGRFAGFLKVPVAGEGCFFGGGCGGSSFRV